MLYRNQLKSSKELAMWYRNKYEAMEGAWHTPDEELDRHLDDAGVTQTDNTHYLLDVGCGDGSLVLRAAMRGIGAEGIDLAPVFTKGANISYGDICGTIPAAAPEAYDFVMSLGSLEHVFNLAKALANIHTILKPTGRWYFFVPNEKWEHFDQPNERTAPDDEWKLIFSSANLITDFTKRWGDCTAFGGYKL